MTFFRKKQKRTHKKFCFFFDKNDNKNENTSDKIDKNEIKTQVIFYLYVCYPPGLEDCSSRPGMMMWETRSKSSFWFLRTKKFVTKSYKRCVCVSE